MFDFYEARDAVAAHATAEQPPAETPPMHQQPEQQQQQQDMIVEAGPEDPETRLARGVARREETVERIYAASRERDLGLAGGGIIAAQCFEY